MCVLLRRLSSARSSLRSLELELTRGTVLDSKAIACGSSDTPFGKVAAPGGTFFATQGAGQEMSVLAAVSSQLIGSAPAPVTEKSGGTSKGNPAAGAGGDNFQKTYKPITTGDRAGAGILTLLVLGSACGMFGWMSMGV